MKSIKKVCYMFLIMLQSLSFLTGCGKVKVTEPPRETKGTEGLVFLEGMSEEDFITSDTNLIYGAGDRLREMNNPVIDKKVTSPEDAVALINAIGYKFGVSNYSFHAENEDNGNDEVRIYYLKQLYEGIPVEEGFFRIYTNVDGTVTSVSGLYVNANLDDVTPRVSLEGAMNGNEIKGAARAELVITELAGRPELSWKIYKRNGDTTFISAMDGTILRKSSEIIY